MQGATEQRTAIQQQKTGISIRAIIGDLSALWVVLAALLLGGLLMLVAGHNPVEAYIALLQGALGQTGRIGETLVKMIPLVLMGLAISIAFKSSYWNIGGEGQFIAGAVLATWVALSFSALTVPLLAVLCFLAAFIGGAFWSGIAGLMKIRFNVNEVISTLMLNYVALYGLMYLIRGPMRDRTSEAFTGMVFPQSALIPDALFLPGLLSRTRLHAGIFLAIILLAVVWLLWKSRVGFSIEVVGANKDAAEYAGIKVNRVMLLVALLSGGIAGLVGWNEIFGIHHRLLDAVTAGYGFLGIIVALLGGLNPWGVLASSFLFSVLIVGGNAMERATGVPFSIVEVINGLVILFLLMRIALKKSIRGQR